MTHDAKCAVAAIKVWCYWCSNWYDPKEWIYKIWSGVLADHFYDKFVNECKSDMTRFYRELSSTHNKS